MFGCRIKSVFYKLILYFYSGRFREISENLFLVLSVDTMIIYNSLIYSYKHAIDGLIRVLREEGLTKLFRGASSATLRATLMTVGQLSFYDQIKSTLLDTPYFSDNLVCHFTSSLLAVSCYFTL